tara:strand:- start:10496 stop:11029 length:534 start_codon:yes stop_codon:yes gene_type:complete
MCLRYKYPTVLSGKNRDFDEDVLYCSIAAASTKTICDDHVLREFWIAAIKERVSAEKTTYVKLTAELEQILSKGAAEVNTKKAEVEKKKAEVEIKKAEVGVKKAEVEVKKAEVEVKKVEVKKVEVKKVEVEMRKAEAETKKAEVELRKAEQEGEVKESIGEGDTEPMIVDESMGRTP